MKFETKAIREGQPIDPTTGAVIMPIYQSTTYAFHEVGVPRQFDYSRSGNPTRHALETCLASLEQAKNCKTFSSGMAATDAVLSLLGPDDHVVACENLYGGTRRLFDNIAKKWKIEFTYVPGEDSEDFKAACKENTKLVWLETPANPTLELLDIAAISQATKHDGRYSVVDNTFLSPYFQNPLVLGADIVLHSTTKYIGGHSDVIGGAVMTNDDEVAEIIYNYQNDVGAIPGAIDCYLTLRGSKTLAVRMRQHEANALAVAEYLETHDKVENVFYPGLKNHPQHELAKKQMSGFGGIVSFHAKTDRAGLNRFIDGVECFFYSESLGGVESLICHPATMSHAVLTEEQRTQMGIKDSTIRLSVGIEHIDDMLEDLEKALARI